MANVNAAGYALPMGKKKTSAGRSVFRIEISSAARNRVQEICSEIGMTEIALCSKVIEFVADLPNDIRLPLLGLFPELHKGDPTIRLLERIAAGKNAATGAAHPDPNTSAPEHRSHSSR